MRGALASTLVLAGAVPGLSACAAGDAAGGPAGQADRGAYRGVTVAPLDAALFGFRAEMRGRGAGRETVAAYARCGAAGYALSRGFGFVRHLRTNVAEKGGIWTADAVYTISPGLPGGVAAIDAEVAVADCEEQGIPTA
ncbi:MAG: hypothetical protein ACKVPY_16955 [Paracoccaceae bacterium]